MKDNVNIPFFKSKLTNNMHYIFNNVFGQHKISVEHLHQKAVLKQHDHAIIYSS